MSEFTEEIPGQLASIINRLGDGEYDFYTICPLPPDADEDEEVYPWEWIQTMGIAAKSQLTVEIRRLDPDNCYRVYTIGRPAAAQELLQSEPIRNGEHIYHVRPAEVLDTREVFELFQHYYDHHTVPAGWNLRPQDEFTTPADPV